ncbi:actin cytoskeleton-regulatory complex protein PAN1 KNAG_0L00860 [Huiozyma naganishii CBS 8797]|uniref:Actin cytoskeleton-regulatory complex protein PAN1 n=1 Tax=Huiozyma naganishii (strain ATCC MYA-139 / BCRC 22969 / CBS 8797 / KCTC 17520 / NBRC 10181 / NCYC 3082 / Yp74L-3) TaxID=1071383 RepID=J7S3M2_HUIN7|nr:hypothetical protein KNAG_0L00860 [Kazachstania naganishii CBS 8797]CCK72707.1 hypothetical protein KNAG_0L00860 [Kazachstania naganishii CBS 8797]
MYNPYQNQGPPYQNGSPYYQQPQQQAPQQAQPQQQQQQQPQFMNMAPTGQQTQQTVQNLYGGMQQQQPQQSGFGNNLTPNVSNPQMTGSFYQQQQGSNVATPTGFSNQSQDIGQSQFQTGMQPMQQQGTGYFGGMQNQGQQAQMQQPQIQQPQIQQPQIQQPQIQQPQIQQPQIQQPQIQQPQIQQPQIQQPQIQQPQLTSQTSLQPLLPQQTGFYIQQSQVPLEPLKPTATGFVNSFANNGVNKEIKIPAMRLSFITANDQAKFETLFRSIVKPGSNTITGSDCRAILLKSGLQPSQLAKIWALCDTSRAGELLFPEFALAMHLINDVLQGDSIPYELDTKTKNEVSSFIDAINVSIAASANATKTPFDEMITAGMPVMQPQPTGLMPHTSFGMPLQGQMTGGMMNPQSTGYMPQTSFGMPAQVTGGPVMGQTTGGPMMAQTTGGVMMPQTSFGALNAQLTGSNPMQAQITGGYGSMAPNTTGGMMMPQLSFGQGFNQQQAQLQPQATGYYPPSNFNPTVPLVAQKTGFGNNEIYSQANFVNQMGNNNQVLAEEEDVITPNEKSLFYKIFETYDTNNKGVLDSPTAVEIFRKSGLNRGDLEHIWNLCDINNSGQLNRQEFALGMHLVYRKLDGKTLPTKLPPSLVPPSTQILDNLKSQLKTSNSISNNSSSKIDALSYKNNDDADTLPNFKNRRKVYSSKSQEEVNTQKTPTATASVASSENIESKYPAINQASLAAANPVIEQEPLKKPTSQRTSQSAGTTLQDELNAIHSLCDKIGSPKFTTADDNSSIPGTLKERFYSIVYKVPSLFSDIAKVDTDIMSAKIELCKSRNPGGEGTDSERRKAQSRALLKSRMAALTGKSVPETDDGNSSRNEEEIAKIRSESSKNLEIIADIRSSISDISASLKSSLYGKNIGNDNSSFQRWEFGVGLEPEVRKFIERLNAAHISSAQQSASSTVDSSAPSTPSYSQFKTSEDRAAYLKEQAQQRMKKKLAKFGLDRRPGGRSRNNSEVSHKNVDSTPFIEEKNDHSTPVSTPQLITKPVQSGSVERVQPEAQDESGSEDEEEKQLREQLQQLKLKKTAEKQKRKLELRRQLEEAKAEENLSSPDKAKPAESTTQGAQDRISNDKPQFPVNAAPAQNAGTDRQRNPFFKQEPANSATSSFDARAAEAQRRIQRGLDDHSEDEWSDDNDKSGNKVAPAAQNANANAASSTATSQPVSMAPSVPKGPDSVNHIPPPPKLDTKDDGDDDGWSDSDHDDGKNAPLPQTAVPVAPPIPSGFNEPAPNADAAETVNVSVPGAAPPVPVAPPLPFVSTDAVPLAPPPPLVSDVSAPVPAVPTPPPVPNMGSNIPGGIPPPPPLLSSTEGTNEANDDDADLSIPESVSSDEEDTQGPPTTGIPPPPPLP